MRAHIGRATAGAPPVQRAFGAHFRVRRHTMKIRCRLTGLALLVLAAASVSWLAHDARAQNSCTLRKGVTRGDWDLPAGVGSLGFLDGKIYQGNSTTVLYRITGVLDEVNSPCLSCREGSLQGDLDDGIGPGPDYYVSGQWIGSWFTGEGTWRATIYKPIGPALVEVGRTKGQFQDPPPNAQLGRFTGRWAICD
jgi:hypothetical protein